MGTALYIALVHCNVFSNYSFTVLRSALLRETMMGTHLYFPSSNGAERNAFDSDGNIAISLAIQYFPFPLRSVPESLLRSQFQRSGAECFWQWWEHCNFSSHSIFPCSALLRANHSQSNGAERNAFDNVTLMMDKAPEHLFFHLRSVPLRVPFNSPEHFYYFPSLFPYCYCNSYQCLNEKIIFLTFFMIPPVFVMLKL